MGTPISGARALIKRAPSCPQYPASCACALRPARPGRWKLTRKGRARLVQVGQAGQVRNSLPGPRFPQHHQRLRRLVQVGQAKHPGPRACARTHARVRAHVRYSYLDHLDSWTTVKKFNEIKGPLVQVGKGLPGPPGPGRQEGVERRGYSTERLIKRDVYYGVPENFRAPGLSAPRGRPFVGEGPKRPASRHVPSGPKARPLSHPVPSRPKVLSAYVITGIGYPYTPRQGFAMHGTPLRPTP